MSDIGKKKNTSKLQHIASRNIHAAQIDDRDEDHPRYVMSFEDNSIENYLPVTKAVYEKVKEGVGLSQPRLRTGLLNCSKFRFSFVVDKVQAYKDQEPKDTIVAIHVIPDFPYNQCDWTEELGHRVDKDIAIAAVEPSCGSITVHAFPNKLYGSLDSFVSALEKLTKIDGSTTFEAGGIKYNVTQIYGNEITFRCLEKRANRI